ncbi:MAG: hypothetical protein ACRDND_03490 [Streptosporangiaceae bacterium]
MPARPPARRGERPPGSAGPGAAAGVAATPSPARLARPAPVGRAIRSRAASAAAGAVGLALGLLALGPGLRRGFLLSYDMVAVPRQSFTAAMLGLSGGPARAVPSDAVLAALSRVVPADIAQKLLLLTIFVLACSGGAALLDREPWFARLAAGVCYTWNPFVAERLILGQWALLLGYAGLPWALRAAVSGPVASWPGAGRLLAGLLPAAAGGFAAMSVSALVVMPAAVLGPGGAGPAPARRRLASGAAALVVLGACSLPWLIPSLLRTVYADPAGVAAYAARADTPFGSLGSLLMLGGGWNAQTVPAGYGGGWSVLWLAFVIAAAAAYLAFGLRSRRWPGLGLAAALGLAIAGIGVTGPGQDVLRALTSLWPGVAILRDGQQFTAPLALAEALGAGLLAAWVATPGALAGRRGTSGAGLGITVALLLAPVLLLPGLAWGAAGRLRPVWYPAGWLAAARLIDASPARGSVLLLPWAAYRSPAWNGGRTLLDPWPRLLSRPVIWNDGPRVGGVVMQPDDPAARRLGAALSRGDGPLTGVLRAAGVRFVVVDSGPGLARRLPGWTVVTAQPGLVVYRLTGPGR